MTALDFSIGNWGSDGLDFQRVVSEKTHNALFSHGLLINFDPSRIKLPWEVGILKEIVENIVPKMPIGDLIDLPTSSEPQDCCRNGFRCCHCFL